MADDTFDRVAPPATATAPGPLLATPGAAERLARLLDLGAPVLVATGAEVLSAARSGQAAAAIVGEDLPDLTALDLCRSLRTGIAGSGLPLIIVSERFSDPAEEEALEAGADEYVDAAHLGARLVRRLRARLRQAWRRQESNPLTGLPGRGRLDQEILRRLPYPGRLSLVALDVRYFKAFNDRYGYARGDDLLRMVRDILVEVWEEHGEPEDFLAHLGGDDFFLVTRPERDAVLVAEVQRRFDRLVPSLYDEADRAAGGVTVFTRAGEERFVPLAYLSAVAVTNQAEDLRHIGQLAAVVAELKEYARVTENRGLVRDRRQIHEARAAWDRRLATEGGQQYGRDDSGC